MTKKHLNTVLLYVIGLFVLLIPSITFGENAKSPDIVWHLSNLHTHPWFPEVMFASVAGWILGMVKGFSTTGDWLKQYLPSKPLVIVFLLDIIVFVIMGAYFGTAIYTPTNMLSAFSAGLTWPIGVGALATKV